MNTTPTHQPQPTSHSSRIALTMGDPAGIGPELVARVLSEWDIESNIRFLCCMPPALLKAVSESIDRNIEFDVISDLDKLNRCTSRIVVCQTNIPDCDNVITGCASALGGSAAHASLSLAADAAEQGLVDAIVTAPLSKLALHLAGYDVPGHTELLAEWFSVNEVAMMLYVPPSGEMPTHGIAVAHATLHTSIASVPALLSTSRIIECTKLVHDFLLRVGQKAPRVGVCALNPHAGEEGLFGDEEARIIAPAVEAARLQGINATGPVPADALVRRALYGEFDGLVAMYHDQGHIPIKLVTFQRAVNVTLGLPIVRTSPSHGTAFDIAGEGKADPSGMLAAVQAARMLCGSRARA